MPIEEVKRWKAECDECNWQCAHWNHFSKHTAQDCEKDHMTEYHNNIRCSTTFLGIQCRLTLEEHRNQAEGCGAFWHEIDEKTHIIQFRAKPRRI